MASALFEGLAYNSELVENYPDRYKSPRELELERRARQGLPNDLDYGQLSEFLDPFYRTYTCADGRGFYIVSCSIVTHPRRVFEPRLVCQRLQLMSRMEHHEQNNEQVFPRSARTCRANGFGQSRTA